MTTVEAQVREVRTSLANKVRSAKYHLHTAASIVDVHSASGDKVTISSDEFSLIKRAIADASKKLDEISN